MGSTAYDPSGQKIGRIGQVYYDGQTNQPTWVTVHTGLFGTHETFVPVQGAELGADRVKGRPEHRRDGNLSPQQEEQLYRYYGLGYGTSAVSRDRDRVYDEVEHTAVGRDTSGPTTDDG